MGNRVHVRKLTFFIPEEKVNPQTNPLFRTNIVPIPVIRTNLKKADRLRKSADSLTQTIEKKRNPAIASLNWTPRRARIAQSMADDANNLEELQTLMYIIADRFSDGTIPQSLSLISNRAQIQTLMSYNDFPSISINNFDLRSLQAVATTTKEKKYVERLIDGDDDDLNVYSLTKPQVEILELLMKLLKQKYKKLKDNSSTDENFLNILKEIHDFKDYQLTIFRRLHKLGIRTTEELRRAKTDFNSLKPRPKVKSEDDLLRERLKELEDRVRSYKIPGFFPTPRAVVTTMLDFADVQPTDRVLEPSAGNGWIADVIREIYPSVELSTIEINYNLRQILQLKGHQLVAMDFLEHPLNYDRIVMNPPFSKGQDIEHVKHAYTLLNEGGKLVSVMSSSVQSSRLAATFREWLSERDGFFYSLPDFSFKSSFIPTSVHAVLVIINKEQNDKHLPF